MRRAHPAMVIRKEDRNPGLVQRDSRDVTNPLGIDLICQVKGTYRVTVLEESIEMMC